VDVRETGNIRMECVESENGPREQARACASVGATLLRASIKIGCLNFTQSIRIQHASFQPKKSPFLIVIILIMSGFGAGVPFLSSPTMPS
jgi:hypothetical protein